MGRVAGKVALITGGARGQGAAEARLLVGEGARVVIADVLVEEGAALAEALGEDATFVQLDVTEKPAWDRAVASALERFGRIDVLVNNAGILRGTPIATASPEEFLEVVKVNQLGTFLGIQAAAAAMADSGGGSIVNVSSVAGVRGAPRAIAYAASKFAVRGMTMTAALELAPLGIRVNCIFPGFTDTPMMEELFSAVGKADLGARIPLGRVSAPEDVAPLVLFLASDESSYCTGGEYAVDGGVTLALGLLSPEGR